MNVPLNSVFSTLQAYLGSAYVNDFTYNNRSYQVRVQAESEFRASADDVRNLDVRNLDGNMVPLGSLVNVKDDFGPSVVRRYNLYPSASDQRVRGAGGELWSGARIDGADGGCEAATWVWVFLDWNVFPRKTVCRGAGCRFLVGDLSGILGIGGTIRELD